MVDHRQRRRQSGVAAICAGASASGGRGQHDPARIRGAAPRASCPVSVPPPMPCRGCAQRDCIRCSARSTQPVLGICLGMQLLFDASEETGRQCRNLALGIAPGKVSRFPAGAAACRFRTWAGTIHPLREDPLLEGIGDGEYVYFVHSYAAPVDLRHAGRDRVRRAIHRCGRARQFPGVQFHPERSAAVGARLLANFSRWRPDPVLLIPAIDLRGGQCVRLLKGEFDAGDALCRRSARAAATLCRCRRALAARGRPRRRARRYARQPRAHPADERTSALRVQLGGGLRDRALAEQACWRAA